MVKRKRSVELSNTRQNRNVNRKQVVKDNRLQIIIDYIKMNRNNNRILSLIKKYTQNDSKLDISQLHVLLLRFLREIKSSFENVLRHDAINDHSIEYLIFINNIRQLTQTMQELSIDETVVIKQNHTIYKILIKDEYKNYIKKKKTPYGFEIEFSAMIIMTIATQKLIDIGNLHKIDDIFDMLDQHTVSSRESASRSPMKSVSRSPMKSVSRSPMKSVSKYTILSKSPAKTSLKSPTKTSSKSPTKTSSKSPTKTASKSPTKTASKYVISSKLRAISV